MALSLRTPSSSSKHFHLHFSRKDRHYIESSNRLSPRRSRPSYQYDGFTHDRVHPMGASPNTTRYARYNGQTAPHHRREHRFPTTHLPSPTLINTRRPRLSNNCYNIASRAAPSPLPRSSRRPYAHQSTGSSHNTRPRTYRSTQQVPYRHNDKPKRWDSGSHRFLYTPPISPSSLYSHTPSYETHGGGKWQYESALSHTNGYPKRRSRSYLRHPPSPPRWNHPHPSTAYAGRSRRSFARMRGSGSSGGSFGGNEAPGHAAITTHYRNDRSTTWRSRRSTKYKDRKKGRLYGHRSSYERFVKRKVKSTERSSSIVHFDWYEGLVLNNRYRAVDLMGEGTFGRVLRCYDLKRQNEVAIKVVRDVERYTEAAKIEAGILREIQAIDVEHQNRCVMLLNSFLHDNRHMCLVFEKLGPSLYDFLSQNEYRGFFMEDIRYFAKQCLQALSFLHHIKLTHTDLKPENILLESRADEFDLVPFLRDLRNGVLTKRPRRLDVKLIDFGNATYEDDEHSAIINTRQYRAPEVILGIGWDTSSDVWSLGCILMELYTGSHLFKTHEHLEHLSMIERIVGPFPPRVLMAARKSEGNKYLHPTEKRLNWPEGATGCTSISRVKNCVSLLDLVLPVHRPFAEFVRYLLEIEASNRPTPLAALQHPFFQLEIVEV